MENEEVPVDPMADYLRSWGLEMYINMFKGMWLFDFNLDNQLSGLMSGQTLIKRLMTSEYLSQRAAGSGVAKASGSAILRPDCLFRRVQMFSN